jgi:hypothetical protein
MREREREGEREREREKERERERRWALAAKGAMLERGGKIGGQIS